MFIHHPPMDVWVVSTFMATVIGAAVNTCVYVSLNTCSPLQGPYLGVRMPGHILILFELFEELADCCPLWLPHVTFPLLWFIFLSWFLPNVTALDVTPDPRPQPSSGHPPRSVHTTPASHPLLHFRMWTQRGCLSWLESWPCHTQVGCRWGSHRLSEPQSQFVNWG